MDVIDGSASRSRGAQLVVNNTMYNATPYPNVLYALDVTKPGTLLKWGYEPKPLAASQGLPCCNSVNRAAAYSHTNSSVQRASLFHTVVLTGRAAGTSMKTIHLW